MWDAIREILLWLRQVEGSTWAAWTQAIGSVAAVIWAARIARAQSEREERRRAADRIAAVELPLQMAQSVLAEMRKTQAESEMRQPRGQSRAPALSARLTALYEHSGQISLSTVQNVEMIAHAAQVPLLIEQFICWIKDKSEMINLHDDPETGESYETRGQTYYLFPIIERLESVVGSMKSILHEVEEATTQPLKR